MTTETAPRRTEIETQARFADGRRARWPPPRPGPVALRVLIAIVFALVIAAATFGVSSAISPTYGSSTQLLVNVNEANGLGVDAISAANQLTAQYVQLVPTDAVLAAPAAKLGMSVGDLRNAISAGSVSQQNLLQINAQGPSASAAQQRAATVSSDLCRSSPVPTARSSIATSARCRASCRP
jgi:capsular polysaccharide biosynthesis protein